MQESFAKAIAGIPDIVTSPYALAAYAIAIVAYVACTWRITRNRQSVSLA
jgi:hypothetical protein